MKFHSSVFLSLTALAAAAPAVDIHISDAAEKSPVSTILEDPCTKVCFGGNPNCPAGWVASVLSRMSLDIRPSLPISSTPRTTTMTRSVLSLIDTRQPSNNLHYSRPAGPAASRRTCLRKARARRRQNVMPWTAPSQLKGAFARVWKHFRSTGPHQMSEWTLKRVVASGSS